MCVNKVEDANVVAHARLWIYNNIIIIKIKGCKIYLDPTPSINGIPRYSWWHYFKCMHLELTICLGEGFEI